ncbi:MAG: DMT family transporter [Erysipelotrichaceae bacterium]
MSKRLKASLSLLLVSIIWGLAFLYQKDGGDNIGGFTYNASRYLLATLSLLFFLGFDKKKEYKSYILGLLCGLILFAASMFQQYGVQLTDYTGKAGFLTDLYIVVVPLFSLLNKEKIPANKWLGLLLCVIGIYFLCMNKKLTLNIGDSLLILCAVFFAFQIVFIDKFAKEVSTIRFAIGQYLAVSILSWIFAFAFEHPQINSIISNSESIIFGGLLSITIGYTVQIYAQKDLDSITASLLMSLESLFCILFSSIILKETMQARNYLGCIFTFAGIIITQVDLKQIGKQTKQD